ncbi:MAG: hypothetical protein ACLUEK_08450 [Oscillospiraceae bacterium]
MELINKYIPAVLEHPLLEVGRSFIFNDALPYIEDMVTEDDLAAYRKRLRPKIQHWQNRAVSSCSHGLAYCRP